MTWSRFWRRGREDDDLARELEAYIEQETADRIAEGMSASEARSAALFKLGNATRVREQVYEMNSLVRLESLAKDFRYAARLLLRSPGFALAAILSLALGIGANTAIFQLVNVVRLRSLPVARPHELVEVKVAGGNKGMGVSGSLHADMTHPMWEELQRRQHSISGAFAWGTQNFYRERLVGMWVSGGMFPTLGIVPYRGRLLGPSDDVRGCGAGPVVLSHGYWLRQFGGSDAAIGKKLVLDDRTFQIVGVTPPEFFGLEVGKQFDVALPICGGSAWPSNGLDQRNYWWLVVMGRLKSGWTLAKARQDLASLSPGLIEATLPAGYSPSSTANWRKLQFTVEPAGTGISQWRDEYATSLWLLLGITGLVLLIACANLANLMLARASAREREIAVRLAIGASRGRLVSQTLAESALLAAMGTVLGVLIARELSRALVAFVSTDNNVLTLDLALDWRVLIFTTGVATLTCLMCGLVPALRSANAAPADVMKTGGRGMSGGSSGISFQRMLVTTQIAVSLVLVVGALLFVRSFQNLLGLDTGFRQDGILFSVVDLSRPALAKNLISARKEDVVARLRSMPQVQSAAASSHIPLTGMSWTLGVQAAGSDVKGWSKMTWVSPSFFETMGVPVVAGRGISTEDTAQSRKVLVVNETFVRRWLHGKQPLGASVRTLAEPDYPETAYEIVGVVRDTKYAGLREEIPPQAFGPTLQHPAPQAWMLIAIRSTTSPTDMTAVVQRALHDRGVHSEVVVWPLRKQVRDGLARDRLMSWLSGFFGLLAGFLASIGLYGVMSYAVSRRSHEIAIRIALGAARADVLRLMLGQAGRLIVIGLLVGGAAVLAMGRAAHGLLFGLRPSDPVTLLSAAVLLAVIALVAAYVPAARAARVSPLEGLRME